MKITRPCAVAVCCAVLVAAVSPFGFCREQREGGESLLKMRFGGISDSGGDQNGATIESLGRFAVDEHNKRENALLEFGRVVKSKEQVVAGKVYYLTIEAVDAGKKKLYEAKVWVKPWMEFKKLEDFKYAKDVATFTSSDLGTRRGIHKLGWRVVPNHDPEVRDAANHAVKTLQQRSNSLFPYQLLEILLAKAEVIESLVRFQLLLKLKRGMKIEEFKVLVSKNRDGKYYAN